MEKSKKREVKRIRHTLDEIVSLAEDDELQAGLPNAVRRYNAIVRHLEVSEILPPGLFQQLSEESREVSIAQVAVESRMLSGYLEDIEEEEEANSGKPDFSPVIALAPFLDQSDLKTLIQSHLSGRGFAEPQPAANADGEGPPSLKTIVGLAPHVHKKDLSEMVEACLAREPLTEPNLLLGLAPHLDRQDFGRLLREYMPHWFGGKPAPSRSAEPEPSVDPPAPTFDR
jgi:hypothetical protein